MTTPPRGRLLLTATLLLLASGPARAGDGWKELIGEKPLEAFNKPAEKWVVAGDAKLDPKNPRKLVPVPGKGVLVNGPGRLRDLITKENYTDVEVHVEFLIGKGSNAGVKMNGQYEIQILDRSEKKKLTGGDCGGIYPRATTKQGYHYLDEGVPPRVNACKKAGEWQSLDIVWRSPRFDKAGKKTANGKFVKVTLNGQVIHDNVEVKNPTGAAWVNKEKPKGPVLLQSDHGPVAWRNVKVRPLRTEGRK
jgi:hypothetical protein